MYNLKGEHKMKMTIIKEQQILMVTDDTNTRIYYVEFLNDSTCLINEFNGETLYSSEMDSF